MTAIRRDGRRPAHLSSAIFVQSHASISHERRIASDLARNAVDSASNARWRYNAARSDPFIAKAQSDFCWRSARQLSAGCYFVNAAEDVRLEPCLQE